MNSNIKPFSSAYKDFHTSIEKAIVHGISVCEIGGGAFPLISDEQITTLNLKYTIVDPDKIELEKAQTLGTKISMSISEMAKAYQSKFDLVISRMVLEHVENPIDFHKSIFELLSPGGKAIHFFASLYGIPSLVNTILPETWGFRILSLLGNRKLEDAPKYKAYYNHCFGPRKKSFDFFLKLGFNILEYYGYVGHSYGKHVPIFREFEKAYNWLLYKTRCRILNTISLLVLSKPN